MFRHNLRFLSFAVGTCFAESLGGRLTIRRT